ncbi:MAG: hypothetical protein ACOYO1_14345 [Bacteroidales bacterium]
MAHQDNNLHLSKEETAFNDFIGHGDDLMKAEIYRNAKECYINALETNFNNELAGKKLSECNALIKSESKAIIIIVSIMAIAVFILLIT